MMEQAWNAPNEPASQQRQQNLSRPESQGARRRPIHEASQGVQPPITQRSQLNLPLSQPESRGAVKRSIHEASSQHGQHGILLPISQQRQQLNLPLSSQTKSPDTTNRSIHEALAQQAKRGFLPPISQQEQILSPTKKKKESTTIFKKITDKFCAVKVEPDPVKRSDQPSSRMPVQPQPSGSQQHVQSQPLPTQKVQQDPSATHSGLILSARQLLEDQQATEQRLSLSPPRVLQDQPMITSQPSTSLSPQRAQDQPIVATVQGCSLSLSPERVQETEASTSQPSRRPALFRKKKKEKKSKELAPAQ
ncbi:hypothetical protein CEXT_118181 [Caerostris extrusa]|uniref:Uncharacterized protein n=1 Tax=Caerostris extrusa TaxID=172846 RepID=A0AAV4UJX1_CAEEX|nr:hypothetical protein CEXT_118181 [Caerostris extrusa]